MPSSAPVLTYRAKELASNIQSKVLKVHNTLININITAISAPEMTYTPQIICEVKLVIVMHTMQNRLEVTSGPNCTLRKNDLKSLLGQIVHYAKTT